MGENDLILLIKFVNNANKNIKKARIIKNFAQKNAEKNRLDTTLESFSKL